jgi:hypothetical protein
MKARSIIISNIKSLDRQLESFFEVGFKPNLAIVFASVSLPINELMMVFEQRNIRLAGCTSCGEIAVYDGFSGVSEQSAAVMLIEIPDNQFSIEILDGNGMSSYELGLKAAQQGKGNFSDRAMIVMASGLKVNGQALLEGIMAETGAGTPIFGGLAGDDARFVETWVFDQKQLLNNGIIMVNFDSTKIRVTGLATSGWISLGADLKVTSSSDNVVFAIDGQPALDVYQKYLSVSEDDLPAIGVEYPLMLKRNDGTTALRAVMGVDKQARSLIFAGGVPEGSLVNFSSSPGFEVIDFTRKNLENFRKSAHNADCLLLFSCMARHLALGPLVTEEIDLSKSLWKAPLAGFFTYGEIGVNSAGQCDFHNQTYTIVLLESIETTQ